MGTDFAASLSASDSTSQGISSQVRGTTGDFIVGSHAGKASPPWLWIGLGALVLVGTVIYFVRR